ncbi:FxsB family radical SAM/SPASM domain protein OS=Streptomyces microflavus OX=1919 GN=G3I39_03110 PE=3 SV=1 [Streptomyces microflavus]
MRRRALHPPLPLTGRLRQPLRLLRRSGRADPGHQERTAAATEAPAVRDPYELLAAQQDLTRTLLAVLHDSLDGSGGEIWETAWALAAEVESDPAGQAGLDRVLAHPYTRTWLLDTLEAVRAGRPVQGPPVERLAASVAAAAVHAGLGPAVPVVHRDGLLFLPTLGAVRVGGPAEQGTALVRADGEGFAVHTEGGVLHIARGAGDGPHWSPVRVLGAAGGPGPEPVCVRDDLDPYRTCFDTPAADRLGPQAADAWSAALAQAWELLAETVPDQAAEAAAVLTTLTTLTPLTGGEAGEAGEAVQVGRHGYGALGIVAGSDADDLAPALLRGFRRAKLRALSRGHGPVRLGRFLGSSDALAGGARSVLPAAVGDL